MATKRYLQSGGARSSSHTPPKIARPSVRAAPVSPSSRSSHDFPLWTVFPNESAQCSTRNALLMRKIKSRAMVDKREMDIDPMWSVDEKLSARDENRARDPSNVAGAATMPHIGLYDQLSKLPSLARQTMMDRLQRVDTQRHCTRHRLKALLDRAVQSASDHRMALTTITTRYGKTLEKSEPLKVDDDVSPSARRMSFLLCDPMQQLFHHKENTFIRAQKRNWMLSKLPNKCNIGMELPPLSVEEHDVVHEVSEECQKLHTRLLRSTVTGQRSFKLDAEKRLPLSTLGISMRRTDTLTKGDERHLVSIGFPPKLKKHFRLPTFTEMVLPRTSTTDLEHLDC
eukprot:GEMP01053396.1.p1 GENE.GEMP01053396.1~~GEMP01053396.1.p1  ORF type:complete len:355 (+),score=55.34 GEMP01053396.1:43-1065(+)